MQLPRDLVRRRLRTGHRGWLWHNLASVRALRRGADTDSEEVQFGSGDLCQIAGVSLRQLQWWDERKIISPRQEGHRRLYVGSDVITVMAIVELRRKGLSLQKIRRLVRSVLHEIEQKLEQLVSGKSELYLITDGKATQFEHESARIIELLKKSRKPLALVSISDMAKRLAEFQDTVRSRNSDDRPKHQLKLF